MAICVNGSVPLPAQRLCFSGLRHRSERRIFPRPSFHAPIATPHISCPEIILSFELACRTVLMPV
jgi:hypothetical protein